LYPSSLFRFYPWVLFLFANRIYLNKKGQIFLLIVSRICITTIFPFFLFLLHFFPYSFPFSSSFPSSFVGASYGYKHLLRFGGSLFVIALLLSCFVACYHVGRSCCLMCAIWLHVTCPPWSSPLIITSDEPSSSTFLSTSESSSAVHHPVRCSLRALQ